MCEIIVRFGLEMATAQRNRQHINHRMASHHTNTSVHTQTFYSINFSMWWPESFDLVYLYVTMSDVCLPQITFDLMLIKRLKIEGL